MNEGVGLVADLPEYVVAIGDLPRSTRRVVEMAGAIVVVDGSTGWWDAAARAVESGAAAVLVAEPLAVPLEAVSRLVETGDGRGIPVLVHRAGLRVDLVDLALAQRGGTAPRVAVAECRATDDGLPAMVRDAVGWVRAFAGGSVVAAAASRGRDAGTALLRSEADRRVVGSVLVAVTSPGGAVLRVQALGETTTEVEIDAALGRTELARSTADGRMVAPARLESGERASVRRAVAAVAGGFRCLELEELLADARAAQAILDPARHPVDL